ncbi:hypothetical protein [Solicola gregarius]|uniref:Uncharacterized protein n=1 Tax=Solicola gregarius TaxID=2908642 RepID=A0AA46YL76_9ACTN|nr:hypothetical protein [Solicola gregarius]UYM05246.1 hypothetical protein L0C25_22470 [Solicola gregarius]
MKRLTTIVCGGLLATAVLTGCGDDSGDGGGGGDTDGASGGDYCGQVEEMKGRFDDFASGDYTLTDMSDTVDLIGDIKDAAPEDVSSQWSSLHSAMGDFAAGMEDLGVAPDEPMDTALKEAMQKDKAKAQEFMKTMSGMQNLESDTKAIEKQVKEECDIDLSEDEAAPEDGGN